MQILDENILSSGLKKTFQYLEIFRIKIEFLQVFALIEQSIL